MQHGRRVVVTGMGITCPIGNSVEESWHSARNGIGGIDYIKNWSPEKLTVKFGGEVKNFDVDEIFGRRNARRLDRVTQLSLHASESMVSQFSLVYHSARSYKMRVVAF